MRGEIITVPLFGEAYEMGLTYEAFKKIEGHTGFTLTELLEVTVAGRLKYEEATLIVWHSCIEAGAVFDDIGRVGKAISELRITNKMLLTSISKYLLNALYAPETAQKKWGAEVEASIEVIATG